jgi:hypothetical protein
MLLFYLFLGGVISFANSCKMSQLVGCLLAPIPSPAITLSESYDRNVMAVARLIGSQPAFVKLNTQAMDNFFDGPI